MKSLTAKIIISASACLFLGMLSGLNSFESIATWYQFLNKPSWNPPNWLFGPVWSVLYILMGVAVALVWHTENGRKKKAIWLFVVQFALNLLWSFIFFTLHQVGWAFVEIGVMLLFISVTVLAFRSVSKWAFYLMLPYWVWVTFASVLNGAILYLN